VREHEKCKSEESVQRCVTYGLWLLSAILGQAVSPSARRTLYVALVERIAKCGGLSAGEIHTVLQHRAAVWQIAPDVAETNTTYVFSGQLFPKLSFDEGNP
jgi:hypothetical protein